MRNHRDDQWRRSLPRRGCNRLCPVCRLSIRAGRDEEHRACVRELERRDEAEAKALRGGATA